MTRQAVEHYFETFDGEKLFYRHWPTEKQPQGCSGTDKVFILLHRGHEHSGRLQHIVDEFGFDNSPVFAWDARGHGRSPGERGYSPGVGASVRDFDIFVRHICHTYAVATEDIVIIAQSVGAVLAATWVHDYAPAISALILAAPAFQIKLYVPFAIPGLRLLQKMRGNFYVNSYVKPKFLTHDPERIESYKSDELITRPIAVNMLLDLHDSAKRIVADASAIQTPTLMLVSGSDFVVESAPQKQFYDHLSSCYKQKYILDDFYHDTLGEKERATAFTLIQNFLNDLPEHAGQPVKPMIDADKWGERADAHRELSAKLPLLSARRLCFAAARALIPTLGSTLSKGFKLGHETGFDSGSTLDYVYENQPTGKGAVGRWLDKVYLESIGWKGIRRRKQNMEVMLCVAMEKLQAEGKAVAIVDIAAGHGRYNLDAVEKSGITPDSLLLRDYSDINVEAGQKLLQQKNMQHFARFAKGDAFDPQSLALIDNNPTLGVVSGLFELFSDNSMILTSLKGLHAAMDEEGYLIYTNQPWHPQQELIARVLSSHRDNIPWAMRIRTQQEMDTLVMEAGFKKVAQRIDEFGIFTVSLAVKQKA